MRLLRILGLSLPILLAALLWWRSGSGSSQLRYYAPQEFVERADTFIRANYLRADCGKEPVKIVPHLDEAPEAEKLWYEQSYLKDDVKRFNGDPAGYGWTFVIDDDCRLRAVNPAVHAITLPFANPIRWLGSILYSGQGSDAVLRSAERTITLRESETPVPANREATTYVGAHGDVPHQGAVLLHFAGGKGQPAARVVPVAGSLVIHNRVRRGEAEEVRLMGHQLPVGRIARLETGDWLHLAAERPTPVQETFVTLGGEALEAASIVRLQNDRRRRITQDPRLGLLAGPGPEPDLYLDLVAGSVDSALTALPEARARELSRGFDLQLTLEREVQLHLSDVFRSFCLRLKEDRGLSRVFPAGMTVLDGVTGDVLALATYPWEEDVEAEPPGEAAARRRLLRNQNLLLHPIGSAGKPFLYAAIADAFPFLATLEIDAYPAADKQRDVLHCEIPAGYRIPAGSGGPVDFGTALQISSNRYTVEIATLALAADVGRSEGGTQGELEQLLPPDREVAWPRPGQSSGMRIAGQPLTYAPDLGGYVFREKQPPQEPNSTAAVRCQSIDKLDQVRFRGALGTLTGADTYWGLDPQALPKNSTVSTLERGYRTNRYDLRPWSPLLNHLFKGADEDQAWRIRAATQEMSPERVNLAFNQITRMREDFVNLLLGGGTSIWTNLQLAESLSRLVTGRAVEARLSRDVLLRENGAKVQPPARAQRVLAPELSIRPDARRAVLEGLRRVAGPGGTAAAMAMPLQKIREAFPDSVVEIYSKTGSPILERAVPAVAGQALERLVFRGRLALEGRMLSVKTQTGGVTPYGAPGKGGRAAFRNELAQAIREVGSRPSHWLVSTLSEVLDDFVADLARSAGSEAPEIDGPLLVDNGLLRLNRQHALFRNRLLPSGGAVYIFSVVRRPAGARPVPEPRELEDSRMRVVTVAIYLGIGPDSHVAVAAAEQILPELIPLLR